MGESVVVEETATSLPLALTRVCLLATALQFSLGRAAQILAHCAHVS